MNRYAFTCLFKGKGGAYVICKRVHFGIYVSLLQVADLFTPKIYTVKQSQPILPGKTMFFANHRSWTDFFMDGYMTGGSSYLSRYGVIVGVPGPCLCGYLFNFVWFFHRKRGIDRNWFTDFFAKKWAVRWRFSSYLILGQVMVVLCILRAIDSRKRAHFL